MSPPSIMGGMPNDMPDDVGSSRVPMDAVTARTPGTARRASRFASETGPAVNRDVPSAFTITLSE